MTATLAGAVIEHVIGRGGRLSVRLETTDTRLRGVSGDTVRVFSPLEVIERSVDVVRTSGALSLRAGRGLTLGGLRRSSERIPDLLIEVPFGAEVTVENGSGAISATSLSGVQHYRGVSGDLTLRDVTGSVVIEVISGDVDVTAVESISVTARTVSGDLRIRAEVVTALQAITTSGDIKVAGRLHGRGPFVVRSVSGDSDLALVGDAVVEARSAAGRIQTDLERPSAKGRDGRRTITLGRGGPSMSVQSLSGDVRLVPPVAVTAPEPPAPPSPPRPHLDPDEIAILRALEDGEIDAVEAAVRLDALDARPVATPTGTVR